jgi:hypothetical protein
MTKKFVQDLNADVVELKEKMDWWVTPVLFGIIEKYGEPGSEKGFIRATTATIKVKLAEIIGDMVGMGYATDLMYRHPTGEFYFDEVEGTEWVEVQERMMQV